MATLAVVVGLRRLRLPMILAFLIVGMCVGPHALGWVTPTETTETLAEFGIVFLLFALGLEFSLPRLIAMRGEVFTLGGLQVGGTTAAVAAVGWAIGLSLPVAILLGGAVAMSSTAIVLRQLTEQDELNRTHGRLAFGVLLFQDLAIVPFLALAGVLGLAAGGLHDAADRARRLESGGRAAHRAGVGALAAAAAVPRDREEQRAGALHLRRAVRRDRRGLGDARRGPVLRARRVPRRHDAGGDGVSLPGRGRHPPVPRHAARPLLRHHRHAARRALAALRTCPS